MLNVQQQFITVEQAKNLRAIISSIGQPTENRVLLLTPNSEAKVGSIIVPTTGGDAIPRKGVVIMTGFITEENNSYRGLIQTGSIITYGLYAGKEIELNPDRFPNGLPEALKDGKLTVLSLNEIIFSETNN